MKSLKQWMGKTAPSSQVVGEQDSQQLLNKTLVRARIMDYLLGPAEFVRTIAAGNYTVDFSQGQKVRLHVTGNTAFNFSFPGSGSYQLIVVMDAVGGRALTINGVDFWITPPAQRTPNAAAFGRTLFTLWFDGSAVTAGVVPCSTT